MSTEIITRSKSASKSDFVCDREETERFLDALGGKNIAYSFRLINPKTNNAVNVWGTLNDNLSTLESYNHQGYGVFVIIQEVKEKGTTNDDVTKIRSLFIDVDDAKIGLISDFHIKPSMIIESSEGKYHYYWLLNEAMNLDDFRKQQKKLIEHYPGTDKKIHDLARVMRLPGFYHTKTEKRFLTRIVKFTGKKYPQSEATLPSKQVGLFDIPVPTPNSENSDLGGIVTYPLDADYEARLRDCVSKQHSRIKKIKEGERNETLYDYCLVMGGWLAPYPNLFNELLESTREFIKKLGWDNLEKTIDTTNRGFVDGKKRPIPLPEEASLSKSNIHRKRISKWLQENGEIKWNLQSLSLEFNGEVCDTEILEHKFEIDTNTDIPTEAFKSILVYFGKENSYHPVRDFLNSLPVCENPHEVIEELLNVLDLKEAIQRKMVKLWLIAAVARQLDPGCKLDNALVFKGKQGLQKTTFARTLFGRDQFQTLGSHGGERDELLAVRRTWCSEMGEIETTFDKKSIGALKAFMSKEIDVFRAPYGSHTDYFKRECIFFGSTNEDRFLQDKTGNRRYWIVDITKRIDLEYIEQNRLSIWGAAKTLYDSKHIWYMTKEEEDLAALNAANSETQDILSDELVKLLKATEYLTIRMIAESLNLPVTDNKTQYRLTPLLNQLGCEKHKTRRPGDTNPLNYWRLDEYWDAIKPKAVSPQPAPTQPIANPAPTPAPTPAPQITPDEAKAFLHSPETLNPRLADLGSPTSPDYLAFKDACLSSGFTAEQIQMLDAAVNYEPQSMIDKF